jgi:N-acetylglucosamine transport system permease protein
MAAQAKTVVSTGSGALAKESPVGSIILKVVTYVLLAVWGLIVVYPMLWSVLTSFKTDAEIFDNPWAMPAQWLFENFTRAWTKAQIGQYLGNTFLVVIPGIFFTLLLSSMAAYVFARYDFKFKKVLSTMFMAGMMFPIFLALVPLFLVMKYIGQILGIPMLNTFHGLITVYVAFSLSWTIFFMTGFFKTLPKEIAEAATIDGATHSQIFFQVMLPLAKPGLVSAGIFNFLGQWNQFILPTVLMSNANLEEGQTRYVVSQGLYYFANQQRYQSDWSGLFAAVAIITIPTLLVYIIFNDRIEKGLTVGAVKG